jgi:hypothetical protein
MKEKNVSRMVKCENGECGAPNPAGRTACFRCGHPLPAAPGEPELAGQFLPGRALVTGTLPPQGRWHRARLTLVCAMPVLIVVGFFIATKWRDGRASWTGQAQQPSEMPAASVEMRVHIVWTGQGQGWAEGTMTNESAVALHNLGMEVARPEVVERNGFVVGVKDNWKSGTVCEIVPRSIPPGGTARVAVHGSSMAEVSNLRVFYVEPKVYRYSDQQSIPYEEKHEVECTQEIRPGEGVRETNAATPGGTPGNGSPSLQNPDGTFRNVPLHGYGIQKDPQHNPGGFGR